MMKIPRRTNDFFDFYVYYSQLIDSSVDGWFYLGDNLIIHELMQNCMNAGGDVCEIGTAYGKSAIALSLYRNSNDKLYLIDLVDENMKKTKLSIDIYGNNDNICSFVADATKIDEKFLLNLSDLKILHIDGSHEHTAVYNDLILFSRKMVDCGIIIMDDFNDVEFPGVNSGIMQFLIDNGEYCIFCVGQNKCYMCKLKYREQYILKLINCLEQLKSKYNFTVSPKIREIFGLNSLLTYSRHPVEFETVRKELTESLVYQ